MNAPVRHSLILALVIGASLSALPVPALAQGEALKTPKRAAPSAPTPRTADGKVDFSGIWTPDRKFIYDINDALKPGETLPIQEWALKVTLERLSKDDPEALCLPAGVPRQAPYPWRILQTPTHVVILHERMSWRIIPLGGHVPLPDTIRLWMGDSVGRWDGNTLVVETRNLNGKTWLNEVGDVISHAATVTERFTPTEANVVRYEATVNDPVVYTRPWTIAMPLRRDPMGELLEVACLEDNQDLKHLKEVRDAARAKAAATGGGR